MLISDAIRRLEKIKSEYGDLSIVGGYIVDDRPPFNFTVINDEGYSVDRWNRNAAVGVFIE